MKLSSGTVLEANCDLISINEKLEIAGGYDDGLPYTSRPDWMEDESWEDAEKLTKADQIELADMMIQRWTQFRKRAMEETKNERG